MNPQPLARTPLESAAGLGNARFTVSNGWRIADYGCSASELEAMLARVALADATPHGKLLVHGDAAEALLEDVLGRSRGAPVGHGAAAEGCWVYRLRTDRYFLETVPGAERALCRRLEAQAAASHRFVTSTDLTHGWAEICVVGQKSRELLSKLCGLSLEDTACPDGAVRETSVAKVYQLVIRRDLGPVPAFFMIGARSLGSYLWEALTQAGREWSIGTVGLSSVAWRETSWPLGSRAP